MKLNFLHLLNQLKSVCNKFDGESNESKLIFLETLSTKPIPFNKNTSEYLNVLLFLCAHPGNAETLILAESELKRMSLALKKASRKEKTQLENSGLPFTPSLSTYTHELLQWMITYPKINVSIDSFYKSEVDLSTSLSLTLPSLEKEYTGMSYNNKGLLQILQVPKESQLSFILSEFSKLDDQPFVKDYFFNALQLYVKLFPKDEAFSKAYNRLPLQGHFFHTEIIKQFDQLALLNKKLPQPKKLSAPQFKEVLTVIKNSLALLQRETDPVTYMDETSFRLYELERGISVAIYGMTPERQLPLESYIGYTLFKNGYPAAYGGAWVFGKRSLFGINIFEPYRGGESGFMMCQLLRVYRQACGVDYFEVEPYQYGHGNPEGIQSGAYWFYYRFGFRSLDPKLHALAENEFGKIKNTKGYRSSEETLLKFTESNVALQLGKGIPLTVAEVRDKVTAHIAENYSGNRVMAEKEITRHFLQKAGKTKSLTKAEKKVMLEIAMMAEVLKIQAPSTIKLLQEMILKKPSDLYAYQKLLVEVLK